MWILGESNSRHPAWETRFGRSARRSHRDCTVTGSEIAHWLFEHTKTTGAPNDDANTAVRSREVSFGAAYLNLNTDAVVLREPQPVECRFRFSARSSDFLSGEQSAPATCLREVEDDLDDGRVGDGDVDVLGHGRLFSKGSDGMPSSPPMREVLLAHSIRDAGVLPLDGRGAGGRRC